MRTVRGRPTPGVDLRAGRYPSPTSSLVLSALARSAYMKCAGLWQRTTMYPAPRCPSSLVSEHNQRARPQARRGRPFHVKRPRRIAPRMFEARPATAFQLARPRALAILHSDGRAGFRQPSSSDGGTPMSRPPTAVSTQSYRIAPESGTPCGQHSNHPRIDRKKPGTTSQADGAAVSACIRG